MRLMLVRHAETGHNADSRVQGQADIALSGLGERQVRALGESLRSEEIAAVVASPLVRARTTAEAIAAPRGLTVQTDPDLMEMHVGEMEGLSTAEMRARFPEFLAEWVSERGPALRMPGGESLEEVRERAWRVVERLRREHEDHTVALVSHNFVLSSLITRALGMPLHDFRRFRLSVCGVTTVRFRADRTVLERLNDTCHLARAGLPSTDPWAAARAESDRRQIPS